MTEGFVTNELILQETCKVDSDLFDFSHIRSEFRNVIDKLTKQSSVLVVGAFGTGKSTMLYQLSQEMDDGRWIFFDAWKYPDRQNLWEGFVLDFAAQVGGEKGRKKVVNKMDGKEAKSKIVDVATDVLGMIFEFSGINIADKLIDFFKASPAKRVFEIQEILKTLIIDSEKDIYIVIEDIDRSGDKGRYFLETLKNFIGNVDAGCKVTCIIPIGDKAFKEQKDSYLKSTDYIYKFQPNAINYSEFIKSIFSKKYYESDPVWLSHMEYFFHFLVDEKAVTIRELKNIFRNANIRFSMVPDEQKKNIDIRIFLIFFVAQHFNQSTITLVDSSIYRLTGEFIDDSIKRYIIMIANNTHEMGSYKVLPIQLVKNESLGVPKGYNNSSDEYKYYISDIYLDIFSLRFSGL